MLNVVILKTNVVMLILFMYRKLLARYKAPSRLHIVWLFYRDELPRSGVIAVLFNEIQRINFEKGRVNLIEAVKTMKSRNQDVIKTHVGSHF